MVGFRKKIIIIKEKHYMAKPQINLVVITSVVHCGAASVFTSDERFDQLFPSISSVQSKIPNAYLVILEGSVLTQEQMTKLQKTGAQVFLHNVQRLPKQYGEIAILRSFFHSSFFTNLTNTHEVQSIHKLSGRYYLTEKYEFVHDPDLCVCRLTEQVEWSGQPACHTRYYAFPIKYLYQFLHGLEYTEQNLYIDVEHSFYKFNVLPIDKIDRSRCPIHVAGYLAPDNLFVED